MMIRRLATGASVLLMASVLAACGGGSKDKGSKWPVMDPTDSPGTTAPLEPVDDESTPPATDSPATDAPAKGALPGAKLTTGDAKSAFNALVRSIATGDGATFCGFMPFDAELAAAMPEGFDCQTLFSMAELTAEERAVFASVKITNIKSMPDGKACVDPKDVRVGKVSITDVLPDAEGDDEPLCIAQVNGHWVLAVD